MQTAARKVPIRTPAPDFSAVLEEVRKVKNSRTKATTRPRINYLLLRNAGRFIDQYTGTRVMFVGPAYQERRKLFNEVVQSAGIETISDSNLFNVTKGMGRHLCRIDSADVRLLNRLERFYEKLILRQHDLPYL